MPRSRMPEADLQSIAEEIIGLDEAMRFVGIINLDGEIVEGIMKDGKSSLESQKEEEHFCHQVAKRRKIREEYDGTLGKVRYVHVEREFVTQLVVYTKRYTVFVSVEPETSVTRKVELVNKFKEIIARHDA